MSFSYGGWQFEFMPSTCVALTHAYTYKLLFICVIRTRLSSFNYNICCCCCCSLLFSHLIGNNQMNIFTRKMNIHTHMNHIILCIQSKLKLQSLIESSRATPRVLRTNWQKKREEEDDEDERRNGFCMFIWYRGWKMV